MEDRLLDPGKIGKFASYILSAQRRKPKGANCIQMGSS